MNKLFCACLVLVLLSGCASVSTLNASEPGAPIVYSGTRLDWYAIQGGCCPTERFGVDAPTYPMLDLPGSLLVDTVLFPLALARVLGIGLNVRGGS
jgi:uncharacterized protein YceK